MNLKFLCICSPSTSTFFDQTTQTPPKGSEISVSNATSDSPHSLEDYTFTKKKKDLNSNTQQLQKGKK